MICTGHLRKNVVSATAPTNGFLPPLTTLPTLCLTVTTTVGAAPAMWTITTANTPVMDAMSTPFQISVKSTGKKELKILRTVFPAIRVRRKERERAMMIRGGGGLNYLNIGNFVVEIVLINSPFSGACILRYRLRRG